MTPEGVQFHSPRSAAPWRGSAAISAGAVLLVMALACGLWFATTRLEAQSRARQEQLVANGLALHLEDMGRSLSPNVIWDDAIRRLELKPDPAWAREFIADYYWREDGYQLAYVLDAQSKPLFAFDRGQAVPPRAFDAIAAAAAPLVADIRRREAGRNLADPGQSRRSPSIDARTTARRGPAAYLVAAALVQADHSSGVKAGQQAPIVVVAEPVDGVFLAGLKRRYLLDDLRVQAPGAAVPAGMIGTPLRSSDGAATARLVWRPHDSVAPLIGIAAPMMAAAFMGLMLFTAMLIQHERKRTAALTEAMRDARQASDAKSAFLATMSHEIRTPLNGILGMAQAIERDSLPDRQRARLAVIRSSGQTLLEILNDVLDLSKIEAGKLVLESVDFDLGALMVEVHHCFTALARNKGLEFVIEPGDAAGLYRGDPTRVRQVLFNLVSNAMKFTDAGEVRLEARPEMGSLILAVSDTGIGIVADKQSTIFGKFNQADASTTRRFGGSGLGLSICRDLVELMGGEISLSSRPGYGSTFTVRLPLERLGDAPADAEAARADDKASDLSGLRVLAAEDNPTNQLVLRALLSGLGVNPTIVNNGVEAVEAFGSGAWDLVLMDVQMPEMDGPTATRAIRAREAETGARRTPIVALTADAMSHQEAAFLAAGMDGRLTKPIDVAQLFDLVAGIGAARDELAA
jgi:signal transduction histidine kinase/CheY-like chemotaxis protein